MPVLITYDIESAGRDNHARIQSIFQRFGWEHISGSCFRYPALGISEQFARDDQSTEDWLNRVVPALMLFRSYVLAAGITISKFAIEVNSSSGYSNNDGKKRPLGFDDMKLYGSNQSNFGDGPLKEWMDGTVSVIPRSYHRTPSE